LTGLRLIAPAGTLRARIAGWAAATRGAADAAGRLQPGLLATSVPGGAAYAGPATGDDLDAVLAAGSDGRIAGVSLGAAGSELARIAALRRTYALVVADLPGGAAGRTALIRVAHEECCSCMGCANLQVEMLAFLAREV